jgi:hypothetical protein
MEIAQDFQWDFLMEIAQDFQRDFLMENPQDFLLVIPQVKELASNLWWKWAKLLEILPVQSDKSQLELVWELGLCFQPVMASGTSVLTNPSDSVQASVRLCHDICLANCAHDLHVRVLHGDRIHNHILSAHKGHYKSECMFSFHDNYLCSKKTRTDSVADAFRL